MRRDGDRVTDILNRAVVLYNTLVQEMHEQQTDEIHVGGQAFRPEGVFQ